MSSGWTLVPSLVKLREEFNLLAPLRDRTSDGAIGDQAHASGASDHNPDETGNTPYSDADRINEVHAIDIDADLRIGSGWDMTRCVKTIVLRHRTGLDNRLQNVIWNRTIWSDSWGWTARAYYGANPHDKHSHFSVRYTNYAESNTKPWGLIEEFRREQEEDMPSAAEVVDEMENRWADKNSPLYKRSRAALMSYPLGAPTPGGPDTSYIMAFDVMRKQIDALQGTVKQLMNASSANAASLEQIKVALANLVPSKPQS